jgi:uracil-DNA glycosylase
MRVLFVGDEPSKLNTDTHVAFVGAKCEPRLKAWAAHLDVTYWAVNSNDPDILAAALRRSEIINQPIITLGLKARKRVEKTLKRNGWVVELYHLPHPSGRNRQLNDKFKIEYLLDTLKSRLHKRP